jgi:hypothetical protein
MAPKRLPISGLDEENAKSVPQEVATKNCVGRRSIATAHRWSSLHGAWHRKGRAFKVAAAQ